MLREVNSLQNEVPARNQNCSGAGAEGGMARGLNRPGIGRCHGVVFVQIAPPAIVEQTERRIAALLNFGQHDAGADGLSGLIAYPGPDPIESLLQSLGRPSTDTTSPIEFPVPKLAGFIEVKT